MATGFELRTGNADVEEWTISSLTLAVGDLLELDVGATAATSADSSTQYWQKMGVVTEACTTADTTVKVQVVRPLDQLWEVEANASSSTGHNGDRMVLTDKNTVNNSGTDSAAEEAVVLQVGVAGATADKRILVRFTGAGGVNPDAT